MEENEKPWFCYMVRCRDGSYYIGIATDVEARVKEHNWGVGASFTDKRRPVKLVWKERLPDERAARKRERELKGWRREKKEELIRQQAAGMDPSPAKSAGSG